MRIMVASVLLVGMLSLTGCGSLILRDDDTGWNTAGKVTARVLLAPATIFFSELFIWDTKRCEAGKPSSVSCTRFRQGTYPKFVKTPVERSLFDYLLKQDPNADEEALRYAMWYHREMMKRTPEQREAFKAAENARLDRAFESYLDGYLFESGRQAARPYDYGGSALSPPNNRFQLPPSMTCMQFGGMLNCSGTAPTPFSPSPSMNCMQYGTMGKGGQLSCH
jgi:hypothetical protein